MAKEIKNEVFPTKYSESAKKGTFEYNNSPSMTEPDNAMSIPEIIARFTRGQGLAVQQHPWTSGSAPEGDEFINDDFSGIVPGLEKPQEQAPQEQAPQEQNSPEKKPQEEAPKE